jgi:hypothetical protein
MKYLIFLSAMVFSFSDRLAAQDALSTHQSTERLLESCRASILNVVGEKIYLRADRLSVFQDQFFLASDSQEWLPLKELRQDHLGYYVNMKEPRCRNGHIGIKRRGNVWYCAEEDCPYSIYENFCK